MQNCGSWAGVNFYRTELCSHLSQHGSCWWPGAHWHQVICNHHADVGQWDYVTHQDAGGPHITRNARSISFFMVIPNLLILCYFLFLVMEIIVHYLLLLCRDLFVNVPNQWETMLHFNIVSLWLGAVTKWSLIMKLWGCGINDKWYEWCTIKCCLIWQ